jgi:hypothetical protein
VSLLVDLELGQLRLLAGVVPAYFALCHTYSCR